MKTFVLLALAGLLAAPLPAFADGHGDHGDRGDRGDSNQAHACVNPAGNVRGWCRNNDDQGDQNEQGQYGSPYPYGSQYPQYPYGSPPNGYGYGYGAQQSVTGVITAISGPTITIIRGLSALRVDATQAFQQGQVYGQLYPSRQITAVGYYDQGGGFHAISIR